MAAFSSLSEKLGHIFSKLKNKGKLSELEVKQALREVRVALLEADVNFTVVKNFVQRVSDKAVGEKIFESLTPDQQVIKIVNDELIALMGSTQSKLTFSDKKVSVYLMCGLQGSGKTTMCAKLALMLKKQGKNPLLAACDVYRPAAIKQLQVMGEKVKVPVFEMGQGNPVKIAESAVKHAEKNSHDVVIIDTAGRLHIDDELMKELEKIQESVKPCEILLVVDSMTGQDAVNVAETFNSRLGITGSILTKLDGDTRGGAALSIREVTGKPIKLCGIGEKPEDIENFYPDRMASRILGMGDVLTLIEKAQTIISEKEAQELQKKIRQQTFTLDDFLKQFDNIGKMGNIQEMLSMVPGLGNKINASNMEIDEGRIKKMKAIIQSMTPLEKTEPERIKSSQKKRIAAGSGTTIQDINQLLKQFDNTKLMMKHMANGGVKKFGKLPF